MTGDPAAGQYAGAYGSVRNWLARRPTAFRLVKQLLDLAPNPKLNTASHRNYRHLRDLLEARPAPVRCLNIGSGRRLGDGMAELGALLLEQFVNTDIQPFSRVHAMCDAHWLPFPDQTFDAVVIQSVLEFAREPRRVISEIRRVLKPGGLVYCEVPFLQSELASTGDYWRFTLYGLRELFRDFEQIDTGVNGGPASSLSWMLREQICCVLAPGRWLPLLIRPLAGWCTVWIKYADWLLARLPRARTLACGVCYLGRRP